MIIPLYCTRFFPKCQEKFYDFYDFFKKFFEWERKKGQNDTYSLPKPIKNRPQPFPQGHFPQKATHKQPGSVP